MKKSFLTIASICGIFLLSSFYVSAAPADDNSGVNEKVLKSFNTVFSNATNVQWSQFGDHFFVSFAQNNITVRAEYDKKGELLSSLRYYDAQHLPLNILCKVKKEYPNKNIDVVTEVSIPEGMAYLIQLQDDKGWTILRSDVNGELSVKDEFQKP
ncbi:MAG TPA: hypothetical protein VK787_10815 [Puia sp.]|jgi:hypothetical protein|nr:hypothetical protein [Puia sp.]